MKPTVVKKTSLNEIKKPAPVETLRKGKTFLLPDKLPPKIVNRKANFQARKIVVDMESFMFKKEKYLKLNLEGKDSEAHYASLTREEERLRNDNAKTDENQNGILSKEMTILNELRNRLAACMEDLEGKKESLDAIKDFANKFVHEVLQRLPDANKIKLFDLEMLANRSLGSRHNDSDNEFDIDLDSIKRTNQTHKKSRHASIANNDMFHSMMSKVGKDKPKIGSNAFGKRLTTYEKRRKSEIPSVNGYGDKKIHQLHDFTKLKKKNNIKDPKKAFKLLTQMEFTHTIDYSESDSDQSIDSDVHNSVLDELDDDNDALSVIDAKGAKTKQRNFTTIKISFKVDIVTLPSGTPVPLIIKKDRIYKSFHLNDIEFYLENNGICGVRLIFFDPVEDVYFAAQFHGTAGKQIQKAHFDKGELINKIHFASDIREIHHIEIVTTKGRSIVIGKTRKAAEDMKLAIVNRYFSDKDMLYNFFAGFNKQTRRIAYIRFLFIRKNLINK